MKLEKKDSKENTKEEKIKLIKSNKSFKRESFKKIDLIRNKFINGIKNSYLDDNGQIEPKQKIFLLMYHFAVLSLCKKEQILPYMQQLGIGAYVTKFFIEADDIFNALDDLQEQSGFLIDYKSITPSYLDDINTFFLKQLAFELNLNPKAQLKKMSRQQNKGNLNELYNEAFSKSLLVAKKIEQVNPSYKTSVFENNPVKTMKKNYSFHDKIAYRNIYFSLYEFNKTVYTNSFSEKDFKIFFYDLLEILGDKKLVLNNSIDSQVSYGKLGNNRYKTKWVDSFLKTWK